MPKKVLFIFGTRPEAIKMVPLIKEFQSNHKFKVIICITAQHRDLLDQVLEFFAIKPDYDLNIMAKKQDLTDITANILYSLKSIILENMPDLMFVHGDTATAFAATLAGFYNKLKIVHIEAGLRSGDVYSPFPEEMNRILIAKLANYHFCPTISAKNNLDNEGVKNSFVVGNTVVDALLLALKIVKQNEEIYSQFFDFLDLDKKIILITCHRRENIGKPLKNIITALKLLSNKYSDCQFVYPVHPNPNISIPVKEELKDIQNMFVLDSLPYPHMIWLMNNSYFILTDSGGIQEEAPSLKKPLLIMRDVTERMELVEIGAAKLVGTDVSSIVNNATILLDDQEQYNRMIIKKNPYGSGNTAKKIINILIENL